MIFWKIETYHPSQLTSEEKKTATSRLTYDEKLLSQGRVNVSPVSLDV